SEDHRAARADGGHSRVPAAGPVRREGAGAGMSRLTLIAKWAAGAAVAVALILFPLSSSPYANLQLSLAASYAVALLGLSIITGHAGQISLAQAAFFGIGAYSAAIFANLGAPAAVAFAMA